MQNAQICDIQTGDIIDGYYRVEELLGIGSYGNVYLVRDANYRKYALKLLRLWEIPQQVQQQLLMRFDMEFETGSINSNYLVHSLYHSVYNGNPYIVMEYCKDGDLLSLSRMERLDYFKIATNVLYGLRDLHQAGKVHRDLKPENVLRKDDGTYALSDFGITGDQNNRMTRHRLSQPGQVFGTYAYIPPEQLNPKRDNTVLPTSDIFSFGVMMYKLITGRLPFGPLNNESELVKYLNNGKSGVWNHDLLNTSLSGNRWQQLIEGCLKPQFDKRIQSADDALKLVPQAPGSQIKQRKPTRTFQTKVVNGVLLRVMQGEEQGKVYRLDDMLKGESALLTIGRQDHQVHNDISIKEFGSNFVSRQHCTLELDYNSGQWVIIDGQWDAYSPTGWKRSTNGTFLNSKEVTTTGLFLNPGDIVSIGETKLRVEGY